MVHVLDSLQVGGTENGTANLLRTLEPGDLRHTVVAMTTTGPVAARLPAGVAVHCLGKRPGWDFRAVARLTALLRRLRPDIVHSRNWGAFDAVPAARLAGVPVVIHGEHGREVGDPAGLNRRRNRLRRLFLPFIDRYVTVSFDLARWLVDVVRIPATRVVTIHNGVDVARFSDERSRRGRAALGVPEGDLVVGTIGRLDPVKDQVGLIEAFAHVRTGDVPATLVIVGDGPCRGALEARAERLGIGERVRFLGARSDVAMLLGGFDVFVLPSIAEGISNTILEAMASGLPVVATETGGNPELVQHDVTGRLVPVGDRDGLAAAVGAYVADPHLRLLHGKAGRARAVEEFPLERMAARYRELYDALILRRAS
ncbi:MAG TPA: glycosyltransferase [Methylomirabilota bacterium]|nr:glycosyltransferase [Methylomirabilota bacterium]